MNDRIIIGEVSLDCESVNMLLVALGKSQETAAQVTSLIMAGATVIGYTIGEGLADSHGETVDGS